MPTYTPLESIVLTSAASSVTFSGISQNYQDLVITLRYSSSDSTGNALITFNSDTSALYSETALIGNGTSATSSRDTAGNSIPISWFGTNSTTDNANLIYSIQNYSNTNVFKKIIGRFNLSERGTGSVVGLYRSTNAISSLTITNGNNNFTAGSTFDLYAISPAAANTAQASGGTEIIYTNTHVIHVFKASGTFTPTRNLTADYLVVAGGGGGGSNFGGGGGAGGLRSTVTATGGGGSLESALSLTSGTSYTVTVGAGGAGGGSGGANGSNSVFSTITSTGGGRAASSDHYAASIGGSGGGGDYYYFATGAAGTANQGYAGGNGASSAGSPNYYGGGGGGAGAVGGNGSVSNIGGNGGNGVATTITGSSVTYAGGGGASGNTTSGTGGTGGGGAGSAGTGTAGTANTGGGGGGGNSGNGGAGGSGIVIVRYAR